MLLGAFPLSLDVSDLDLPLVCLIAGEESPFSPLDSPQLPTDMRLFSTGSNVTCHLLHQHPAQMKDFYVTVFD